jgi:hypothetical protein
VEIFNLRKLSEMEVRKKYHIRISNRSAALENSNDNTGIKRTQENVQGNIKSSSKGSSDLYELKRHKSWFDEASSRFFDTVSRLKRIGYRIQTKAMQMF